MKLSELEIMHLPSARTYQQRIRGKNNYQHQSGRKKFNGSGGCEEYISPKLLLSGIDENGKEILFDIRKDVLDVSGRVQLREAFVDKVRKNLPDSVEIKNGVFPDAFWKELVK